MLITKIEAKEACDWLRAAGFPQYVQLFKDCRFPIDTEWVKRDHHFLDKDALDSLCRRLNTLNKCVEMRLEPRRSKQRGDDRGEDDFCAISPSWTYDRRARRWQRRASAADPSRPTSPHDDRHDVCSIHSSSSSESAAAGASPNAAATTENSRSSSRCSSTNKTLSLDASLSGPPSPSGGSSSTASLEAEGCGSDKPPRKKGTSLLRKMEKLRLRGSGGLLGSERGGRPAHGVTGRAAPLQEGLVGEGRMERLHGPSSSCASSSPSSPHTISSSSSNSQSASSSAVSTPSPVTRVRSNCKRSNSSGGQGGEDYRNQINNNNNLVFQIPDGHKPGTFPTSLAHKHASLSPAVDSTSVNWRTGSFHGYRGRHGCLRGAASSLPGGGERDTGGPSPNTQDHRLSVYDNVMESEGGGGNAERAVEDSAAVTRMLENEDVFSALDSILESINDLQQLVSSWSETLSEDECHGDSSSSASSSSSSSSTSASSSSTSSTSSSQDSPAHGSSPASPCPSSPSHIHLEVQPHEEMEEEEERGEKLSGEEAQTTSPQARSSRSSQQPHWSSEQSLPSLPSSPGVENLSASQFLLLQKLSLLKLTALMDKHSPSSKQGWSWTVPKSQRKTKVTEVKGRRVFGVPLLLNAQQSGEPLPPSILQALDYLRTECLDQVGLFRKSGLKSRIQYLRELVESDPDCVSYEGQSAFDVADMVKQYFRDLPEPIFTCRLCESFLHIYQYFPKDQQLAAAQAAILLLPDENREALRTLLSFLHEVVACVDENQMTPTNLAVCLAPSLFHLNTLQRDANAARSGHRKYSLGRPDQRDLSENLAATQGLANMITEAQRLFELPEFWPAQTLRLTEESEGEEVEEEEEEAVRDERERSQLQLSTQLLLKEARERSHGWEEQAAPQRVELAFKKMDDGCPLWLWRGSVEVEAPQAELLRRLLWEAEQWQRGLQQPSVLQTLSKDAHIYRCLLHGPGSQPPRQHLLLRTWQADPSAGALYLSSVSTEHPEAPVEGVRAHVHACLYLLEPAGARRTRLIHLCRTDTRGRSPQWQRRVGGALLASGLLAIKDSFRGERKDADI